ncbi:MULTISPECIES: adenylosuccinate lyase [Halorubrum]|uniref:Adenylosuccinate lyase n=1 Tax=Halorubrum hochstenium ATCC 700873 TaxID=1227481 RepID=M0FMS0_9EURY|nr:MULTISPECIES: adenylosuccinate lyase [Halorubrum]ELZ60588.1 adenylosuccinate lyase [Halorubrum hochstenium ATCC 700873]
MRDDGRTDGGAADGADSIPGLSRSDPLAAVSPLDGRYAGRTAPLSPYASEAGLMRARTRVEVEYLIALADLDATPIGLDEASETVLRAVYEGFSAEDARLIKRLETEGAAGYDATNHDVKAVEYFLRVRLAELAEGEADGDPDADGSPLDADGSPLDDEESPLDADGSPLDDEESPLNDAESLYPWIHFGLTSEDVNNLAQRLLLKPAVSDVIVPAVREVRDALVELAQEHRDAPMLARTHGQPATPTTFGKEMAVYAARLGRALGRVVVANEDLSGKLAGASGTYAAHRAAYPDVDWRGFSESFVRGLDLEHTALATQVNPCDDLAALFDALRGVNNVLLDLDLDAWLYVSDRYLGQEAVEGETGSSTMPHKVNPIDFENSEGNLSVANSDLTFLADYVTNSRLQRDLSDSTVKRNVGAALAHCLIGYSKAADGLGKVVPNEAVMREELEATPEVIGEAVQTILRREGDTEAYERVKALSRGRSVTLDDFRELFDDLDIDDEVRAELKALTPAGYTGVADDLVDELDE